MIKALVKSMAVFSVLYIPFAASEDWQAVTGKDTITQLFSDRTLSATLAGKQKATAIYNADGTGQMTAWGETFQRQWKVEDDKKICLLMQNQWNCFSLEKSTADNNRYRATQLVSGEQVIFSVNDNKISSTAKPIKEGGAGTPSADEIAKELSNPNTSVATLTLKMQHRMYKGDLPGADDQSNQTLLFQPGLPFKRDDGSKLIFRPAIPVIIDQPSYDGGDNWGEETGLGDISFDLAYAFVPDKDRPGNLQAVGLFASLPTGDDDLGLGESTTLGPEYLYGEMSKEGIWGLFPNHQWDVGGDVDISLTTLQVFYFKFAPGGWVLGTSPILSYDHEGSNATLPLNFTVTKTVIWNGRPWKLGGEINYYVDQPDEFGPEWMFSINIAPVVKNALAEWF